MDHARDNELPSAVHRYRYQRDAASYIRLEIRTDALCQLINNKALVIEDLRGLDRHAKILLKDLLLETLLLQRI